MRSEYTIPLSQIEKEFSLERITVPEDYESVLISTPEVWRPGLAMAGFYDVFDQDRVSLLGNAEHAFLSGLEESDRKKKIYDFVDHKPVAIIFTSNPATAIIKDKYAAIPIITPKDDQSMLFNIKELKSNILNPFSDVTPTTTDAEPATSDTIRSCIKLNFIPISNNNADNAAIADSIIFFTLISFI
jgi:serine kinase of HPr protein (carbohydrate metabolism regulator)